MKQDLGPLGTIDVLTDPELREALGHHFTQQVREWYRGIDYLGFAGGGNGTSTITLPISPEQGYTWDVKLVSAQLAAPGELSVYPGDNPTVAPIGVTSTSSFAGNPTTASGTFAAAGNGSASLPANSPITGFTISWGTVTTGNTVTITVTNTVTGQTLTYADTLAVGQNNAFTVTYPSGGIPAAAGQQITVTVTGNVNSPAGSIVVTGAPVASTDYDTVVKWSSQQVVIKDGRNITLASTQIINNWRVMVKQVPTEMQGKL